MRVERRLRRPAFASALAAAVAVGAGVGPVLAEPPPAGALVAPHAGATPSTDVWTWPVVGPVVRPFEPPATAYGAGHRGIDIAAAIGTPVLAPAAGTVRYAGRIGGALYASIDHAHGLQSTYSWLDAVDVQRGDVVFRGQRIGTSGAGHPGTAVAHLHFGVKLDGAYIDPLSILEPPAISDLIRLAPLEGVA
jgi:murein DD-endopeptidase MepM/ murein hydrolase activator NlpD